MWFFSSRQKYSVSAQSFKNEYFLNQAHTSYRQARTCWKVTADVTKPCVTWPSPQSSPSLTWQPGSACLLAVPGVPSMFPPQGLRAAVPCSERRLPRFPMVSFLTGFRSLLKHHLLCEAFLHRPLLRKALCVWFPWLLFFCIEFITIDVDLFITVPLTPPLESFILHCDFVSFSVSLLIINPKLD